MLDLRSNASAGVVRSVDAYMDMLAEEKARLVKSMAREIHGVLKNNSEASKQTFAALKTSLNNE